jgi:hypothetical protein
MSTFQNAFLANFHISLALIIVYCGYKIIISDTNSLFHANHITDTALHRVKNYFCCIY